MSKDPCITISSQTDTYLVGGAVRDELLNRETNDRDWVVVGSAPELMLDAGFRAVGQDFPVFLHPQTQEEYALARTERKSGHGYTGFDFHAAPDVTIEQDLSRRDLTINAIAQDSDGSLVDPFDGQKDIEQRVLRHVSPAFIEDPLRVLRVARFAAQLAPWGFSVATETIELMQQIVTSGELKYLTAERVWQETFKALQSDSIRTFVEVLRECNALEVLFPEIDRMFGVPQKPRWHPEIDCGVHLLMALDQAVAITKDPAIRYGVLVHDLGKGTTPEEILPSHYGHEERGVPLVAEMSNRIKAPKQYRQLGEKISRWHLLCHKVFELKATTIMKILEGLDTIRKPEIVTQFTLACEADARGRLHFENTPYPQGAWLRKVADEIKDIRLDHDEREGLTGVQIGEKLRRKRLSVIKQMQKTRKLTEN